MSRLRRAVSRLRPRRPEPVVLMYHRVSARPYDPWGLQVEPGRFEARMEALASHRLPLPLEELVARLERDTLPDRAVVVTFDDGYLDNLRAAKPRLEAASVPATVFLTTDAVGSEREYWWDELARMTLGRRQPVQAEIEVGGRPRPLALPRWADDQADHQAGPAAAPWRAWEPARTAREAAYSELWTELRGLSPPEREAGMEALRGQLDPGPPDPADLPLSPSEVAELADGDLVDIGAHSRTHAPLTTLAPGRQRQEIEGSRQACERLVGRPITGFAYPHGDHDPTTRDLVRSSGLRWACSTRPADPGPVPGGALRPAPAPGARLDTRRAAQRSGMRSSGPSMTAPQVSAVMIFLDAERFMAEAIDSVLAQEFADFEVLLVDDGSQEACTALARGYAARSCAAAHRNDVHYLEHPGHANRGMSASRNLGIAAARGDLIAFIDADDVCHPAKLAEQVAIMHADPELGLVCGTVRYWRSWDGGEDVLVPTGHVTNRPLLPPRPAWPSTRSGGRRRRARPTSCCADPWWRRWAASRSTSPGPARCTRTRPSWPSST